MKKHHFTTNICSGTQKLFMIAVGSLICCIAASGASAQQTKSTLSATAAQRQGMNGDSGSGPIHKKLIHVGWDLPTAKEYVENVKAIEASPFDGVGIKFNALDDEGNLISGDRVSTDIPWKKEWFQADVDALKKTKSPKLAESFCLTSLSVAPKEAKDVFDDAAWKIIVEHFRVAAWVAKQAGLKGLMLDVEGSRGLRFSAQQGKSFDEYAAQTRKRGREMMEAMTEEYPDMTLIALILNSGNAMGAFGGDPREALVSDNGAYSLIPALVNGWLDAIPPTMTVVDGMEHSYPHTTEIAYLRRVNAARNLAFVDAKNRQKFRAQFRAGLAIYMDAFLDDKSNAHSTVYTIPPLEGSLTDRLRQATIDALDIADKYVWVWGERYRFWPTDSQRVLPYYWDQILPGATEALRDATNVATRRLAIAIREFAGNEARAKVRGIPLRNLLLDGDMTPAQKGQPTVTTEEPWAAENSTGTLERSKVGSANLGSLMLQGTKDGAWTQTVEINPNKFYKVRVSVRQMGKGTPELRVIWLDGDGKKISQESARAVQSPNESWVPIETMALAPPNAVKVAVQLAAKDQTSPDDQIWYDNAALYRVSVN